MTVVPLQIAIDGPVGSGKSAIASQLAKRLGITYLYTGAMYRALALVCRQQHVPCKDIEKIRPILVTFRVELFPPEVNSNRPCLVKVAGVDVTELLFTPENDIATSDVSTLAEVRQWMVAKQQQMASQQSVVMEGRDIALRVLPKAHLKIYLTASLEERARRRQAQYLSKGIEKSLDAVIEDTKIRDTQDTTRAIDPLQRVPDAWELDTTNLDEHQVIDTILAELSLRRLL